MFHFKSIINRLLGSIIRSKPFFFGGDLVGANLAKFIGTRSWNELDEFIQNEKSIDEWSIDAYEQVSYAMQQQMRFDEALQWAEKALSMNSQSWMANFIAGVAYKELGQLFESESNLKVAVNVSPSDKQTLVTYLAVKTSLSGVESAFKFFEEFKLKHKLPLCIEKAEVISIAQWTKIASMPFRVLKEPEKVPFVPPIAWKDSSVTAEKFYSDSNTQYIAELKNIKVYSHSSLLIAEGGYALSDLGADERFGKYVNFTYEPLVLARERNQLLIERSCYSEQKRIGKGFWMVGEASSAYGHWLPEYLPRIEALKKVENYKDILIIVDHDMPQSHFEYLRLLCPENEVIAVDSNSYIMVDNLFVSPMPCFNSVELLPEAVPVEAIPGLSVSALEFLRESINKSYPKCVGKVDDRRKTYLARRNMRWRRVDNEAEVVAFLEDQGFDIVYLEEMTIREQIDVFRNSSVIIGPNGSALLNIIYASPDTLILVLSQHKLYNWGTLQGPMEQLGYNIMWMSSGDAIGVNNKHSDFIIDIEELKQVLEHLVPKD